jgi:DNA primase large subunit
MAESELDFAVRYPFTDEARKAIAQLQLTESIADLGVRRIKRSLESDISASSPLRQSDKEEEIASFGAARMILGFLRNSYLTSRFAVNEAKKAHAWLDKADEKEVEAVARIFGITASPLPDHPTDKTHMGLPLPVYLRFSPRSVDYRITNRRLANGVVEITWHEKKRLLEEAIRKHVERIPLVRDPPDMIKLAGEKLLESLPKNEPGLGGAGFGLAKGAKVEDHPPCIEKMLESMRKHENLPHQARYFLATYFMAIGMNDDAIAQVFSDAPDFHEKTTRYQVAQIRKKGYSVPSCATVMTYGFCIAVCRIGSPLNWHTLGKERKGYIKQQIPGYKGEDRPSQKAEGGETGLKTAEEGTEGRADE